MKYLSESLSTSYFDRAKIFAALRNYAPEIILGESDGSESISASTHEKEEIPDWLKDYSGYAHFDLKDIALLLSNIPPDSVPWEDWDDASSDALRHLGFLKSRADELGVGKNSYEKVPHELIRSFCAKYGKRWPVPELTPLEMADSNAHDTNALRQQLAAMTAERDAVTANLADEKKKATSAALDYIRGRRDLNKEIEQLRQQLAEAKASTCTPPVPTAAPDGWQSVALPHVSPAMSDLFQVLRDYHGTPPEPGRPVKQDAVQAKLESLGVNSRVAQSLASYIKPDGKISRPKASDGNIRRN